MQTLLTNQNFQEMGLVKVKNKVFPVEDITPIQKTSSIHFKAANTEIMSLEELSNTHKSLYLPKTTNLLFHIRS